MTNSKNSWEETEIDKLGMALAFAYKVQNTYKEPLDLPDRVQGWRFILEEEFTLDQVLYALKQFMKQNKIMPVPADMYEILKPTPPRITEAQFVEAQKWQERNGYPVFSDALDVIEKYKAQEQQKHKDYEIHYEKIRHFGADSIKKIGG